MVKSKTPVGRESATGPPRDIDRFDRDYAFLSNFWRSRVRYPSSDPTAIEYPTVEHAFQAAKTDNMDERERICATASPVTAKRMGRRVALRPDWETLRIEVMRELLRAKFADPALRAKLLETGQATLIEGNLWHDQTWGSCRCDRHSDVPGRNLLGQLLMEIREDLAFNRRASAR